MEPYVLRADDDRFGRIDAVERRGRTAPVDSAQRFGGWGFFTRMHGNLLCLNPTE
jgi:hypothetical protein